MRVEKVLVDRVESYMPNAGELRGIVVLQGPTGRIEVPLSKDAMSMICAQVSKEVQERTEDNVRSVKHAFDDVVQGALTMD